MANEWMGLLKGVQTGLDAYNRRASELEQLDARERQLKEERDYRKLRDAEDDTYKKDQLGLLKDQRDFERKIKLREAGLIEDGAGGLIQDPNVTSKAKLDNQKWAVEQRAGKGAMVEFDETGAPVFKGYDPTYLKMQENKLMADPFGNKELSALIARANLDDKLKGSSEERKAAGFTKRLEQADAIFDDLERRGYNRANAKEGLLSTVGGLIPQAKSSELSQQEQAERNFINAQLRKESGAAISPSEYASAEKQYFPRPGDSKETLEQKRQNRLQARENLKAEAGVAYNNTNSAPLKKAASTKIKISNGKETLMIDPSDLAEAQKDGFKAVK